MDDQARKILDTLAALAPHAAPNIDDAGWLANFRYQTALLRGFGGAAEPVCSVTMATLGGIPVRRFQPQATETGVLLHLHGGGGVAGSLDTHDPMLRLLAARTGWAVIAPDYRLAPGHRFPAQLDDGYAVLVAAEAEARGRLVVSGDSIGATLATALTMMARDRAGPRITGQILFYPNTDLRRGADYPSRSSEDGKIILAADLERQIGLYVGEEVDREDPLASPLLAERLADLPAALIATCEHDPLRDEGEAYAHRLRVAGVAVAHHRVPGMIHAFLQMAGEVDASTAFLAVVKRWLDDR